MNFKVLYKIPDDYPKLWQSWTRPFRGKGSVKRKKILLAIDKVLVVIFILLYALIGFGCLATSPGAIIGYVISTGISYLLVSLLRSFINAPRPYQVFDIKPLVPKKSQNSGKSFPSRHAFCAFLIATISLILFRDLFGVLIVLFAIALGCIRVLEGKHFPRDICAGAILGIVLGMLCTSAFAITIV